MVQKELLLLKEKLLKCHYGTQPYNISLILNIDYTTIHVKHETAGFVQVLYIPITVPAPSTSHTIGNSKIIFQPISFAKVHQKFTKSKKCEKTFMSGMNVSTTLFIQTHNFISHPAHIQAAHMMGGAFAQEHSQSDDPAGTQTACPPTLLFQYPLTFALSQCILG